MRAQDLRSGSEKTLYVLCVLISLVVWAVVVVTIVGLLYGLLVGFFLFVAHALFIAYIKGNGVKLSETQLPVIYRKVVEASQKLGLDKAPEAYVMQAGGMLNAFATKFVGRNFIVIYSDLLEACDEDTREMDMIIGHEVGHLALGHLKLIWFLLPAHLIPWLWPAYSRQREYSCDRCGYEIAGDFGAAARGLAVLAAGGKYGKQVNLDAFTKQLDDTKGFWTSVYELNASHPYLPKRIATLVNLRSPGTVPIPGRHPLAYPLAPVFAIGSPAGAGPLVLVMMIAIIAAIAIPQFAAYREKAEQAVMDSSLKNIHKAAAQYQVRTGALPCSMEELQLQQVASLAGMKQWQLVVNCNERLAAVVYNGKNGKKGYRAIYFDDGRIEAGDINE
jgi:Zn-dependent protease with chaperone function/Tfp pilus assembly major pilin PilA